MIGMHATNTTFQDVVNIRLTKPEAAGGDWKGVPHSQLITAVANSVQQRAKMKCQISKAQFLVGRDGADCVCSLPVGDYKDGVQPFIGFATSNACRKALEFYVGAMVGDMSLVVYQYGGLTRFPSWGYTDNFNLTDVADEAVEIWRQMKYRIHENLGELEALELSEDEMRLLLMDYAVAEHTTWSSLGMILKWYRSHKGSTGKDLLEAFSMNWSCRRPLYRLDVLYKVEELTLQTRGKVSV